MERSTARVEDSADRRTELAADRTVFAAERTYAAWVRTGLFAMASGLGAKALLMGTLPNWLIVAYLCCSALFVSARGCGGICIPGRRHQCPMRHAYTLRRWSSSTPFW